MFGHLFVNRLKILFRDKELIFWTLIFPLILATLFNLAFSKINETEKYTAVKIAVVVDEEYEKNEQFKQTLEIASKGEERLFDLEKVSKQEAEEKLLKGEIKGYILGEELTVKEQGLEQTIIKQFLDVYHQKIATITSIAQLKQGKVDEELIADIVNRENYIEKTSYSKEDPNSVVNYFYTLIAMACLYGGFWGVKEIRDIQANQSWRGARINLAPVHKIKTILYNLAATFCINFLSILLLLIYLVFGLKIDFGNQMGYVLFTCFIGCILGISMGMFIGSILKKGETIKTAVLLAVTMTWSFLAGMMYIDMKYIIASNIPILGYLNPANLLTDALYALYYYDTLERYTLNMTILGVFCIVFLVGTYLAIRRQKYESI